MSDATRGSSGDPIADRLPLVQGAAVGAGGYVLGYLLTYVLQSDEVRQSGLTSLLEFFSGEPSTWKVVGWLFYNAHFVNVVVPGFAGSRTVNLITEAGNVSYLYVLPPLVLLLAGGAVAWLTDCEDPTEGAKAGATVVLGYLVLALVGAFVFTVTVGDNAIRPDVVTAFFVAGVVYPAVFGAVGGALGSVARNR